ncbi:MAG: extracellular solute-binding protein [Clostridiales bacterium]|nr:extracellular solute-binding protein [Clostridiales bacterium]
MKRKLIAAMAATTALTAMAGCYASAETTLTFAWWGNQTRTERTQAVLDMYAEENEGITFDTQTADYNDYWTKLATSAAGNALPELIQMDYTYVDQYADNGLLIDLTPYVESGVLDVSNISEDILAAGTVDGQLVAICNGVNAPSLLYNKTITDELGIEINDNMTLDEFMDIARQIYEETGIKTDLPYEAADNWLPYILRSEDIVDMFTDDGLNVEDSSAFERFFEIYQIGAEEGWIIGADIHAELTSNSVEESPLIYYSSESTQSWCAFFWSNQLSAMTEAAPEDMEIGITTWPSDDPVKSDFLKPSQFFSVTRDAGENEEEAVKVLNYIINSVEANEILLGERGVPATSVVAEAISPLLDEAGQTVTAFINDVVTPNSSTISAAVPEGASEVFDYANQLVDMVLYGQMDAAEAAESLFTEGNSIMSR